MKCVVSNIVQIPMAKLMNVFIEIRYKSNNVWIIVLINR